MFDTHSTLESVGCDQPGIPAPETHPSAAKERDSTSVGEPRFQVVVVIIWGVP